MIAGMTPLLFLHVAISLVGIASGFVVIWGLLAGKRLDSWTAVFLATTVATSVTGFFLPADKLLPSHVLGIISLVALAIAIVARYPRRMAGPWRLTYAITAVIAQYLNFFVLIVQSFQKVPVLRDLTPTQSEPPFAVAQLVALVLLVALGVLAAKRFRVEPATPY